MADWRISRRRGVCHACERAFDDGERHVSTLRVGAEGLERADVCLAWWEGRPGSGSGEACRRACLARAEATDGPQELFWWATRHELERRNTVQLDLDSLERLFLELEGHEQQALQELRYVLCLILMRKRRLKVERVLRTADGEAFQVRRPRREERHAVRVFDFSPERVEEVRTQLQAIFDGAEEIDGVSLGEPEGGGEAASSTDPEPAAGGAG